jgi:hypothetical protein
MTSIDNSPPPSAPPPPEVPAAAPKTGFLDRLIGVLTSPSEAFASIARQPDWVAPFTLIIIVAVVGAILLGIRIDWHSLAEEATAMNPNIPADRVDSAVGMTSAIMKMTNYLSPILAALVVLIAAAVLMVSLRLFAGEINFAQAFSVTLYAWIPRVIKGAIGIGILFARGSVDMYTLQNPVASNPGAFVDPKSNLMLYTFLTSIDVFNLWTLFLLTIGFAIAAKVSRGKSAAIVVGWWVVINLLSLVPPALQLMKKS